MARPRQCRCVGFMPSSTYFKPRGIPLSILEEVILTVDEFEAIRLADLEGLYQEEAAVKMRVSRQTFGRIIEGARKKIADVLINGKALRIQGGDISIEELRLLRCRNCRKYFDRENVPVPGATCPGCRKKHELTINP